MKKAELVFIPSPGISHLGSTLEIAKLLADMDEHLSISVIIMKFPNDTKVSTFLKSLSIASSSSSRIKFIELNPKTTSFESGPLFLLKFIESHRAQVRDFLSESVNHLSGVVVDMFCTSMIDVANEFEVPSYVFSTSGAAMLGLLFHFQSLGDIFDKCMSEIKDSVIGLSIPSYRNLVPYKVLPSMLLDKDGGCNAFLNMGKRFRETKGIILNTFLELESHAIEALSRDETVPPVYTGGPILQQLKSTDNESPETEKIVKWLDMQPEESVVFLCFGNYGHFSEPQVKEIAYALEGSGHRFLWSLRKPPTGKTVGPGEYENLEEVLPKGFLQRTASAGMVIGWAPQASVLSHVAVGGFVSHCGWNSILESIWFGVPMAAWPLFAEQQMNAFEFVEDLGLAVEIKMDYRRNPDNPDNPDADEIVKADVIKEKIKILMDPENGIKNKVKEKKEKSRLTLKEGGSSSASLKCFINDVIKGLP